MIDGIEKEIAPIVEKAKELAPYGNNRVNFKKLKIEASKVAI